MRQIDKNLATSIVAIAAVFIAVVMIWLKPFQPSSVTQNPLPTQIPTQNPQSLGEEIYNKVKNPAQAIPETNPLNQAKVNPYKDSYKNPFE